MEYIVVEVAERNYIVARQGVNGSRYHQLGTCRSRGQAEALVNSLNGGSSDTIQMVKQFHQAFRIDCPEKMGVVGVENQDVNDWLKDISKILLDAGVRIKKSCGEMKQREIDVTAMLRMQLMVEELGEVLEAMQRGDISEVLHELADLRYVVDGTALAFGLGDVYVPAVREIHRANMSKLDAAGKPVIGKSGRVEKSKLFKKADVSFLVKK
jgi:predicted HAD superfamily Cof-like phosphohydrolase